MEAMGQTHCLSHLLTPPQKLTLRTKALGRACEIDGDGREMGEEKGIKWEKHFL